MRLILSCFFLVISFITHATPSIQKYTLDNGLKIIVKEDHRAPVAVTMVWYNVGSADEPGGITGISHAIEHMMFKGTQRYPAGVFSKSIAALGGEANAMTNYDYTAYYEKIAATKLPLAFELEADRMRNLLLNPHEFTQEIKVIREERRLRTEDNPQAITFERFMTAANLAEPYHHPIIGWMSDLKQLQLNDVKAWYESFYTPNNATLIVVGDVEAKKIYELANLYFGKLAPGPTFLRKKQAEPASLGAKLIEIHHPAKLPLLMLGYTVPSIKTAEQASEPYILQVIAGILNAGDSARFPKNLIRSTRIASAIDVKYNLYTRYQSQFIILAIPAQNHTNEELKRMILVQIKRLQNETIENSELLRIKTKIIAQKTFEKDSIFSQAMELGLLNNLDLAPEDAETFSDKINRVTAKEIQEVSKRYFHELTITEARLIPNSQPGATQ